VITLSLPKWMVFTATAIIGIIFVIAGGFFGDKIYKAYFLPGQMIPNMTFSAKKCLFKKKIIIVYQTG
jgi:hypothetical protein